MKGGDVILININRDQEGKEVKRTLCCLCNTGGVYGIDYQALNGATAGTNFPGDDSPVIWNYKEATDDPCPTCGQYTYIFKESGSIKKLVKKWRR